MSRSVAAQPDIMIDPSSTRTGYAIMRSPDVVIEAGYLTPKRQRDEAVDRIATMATDLKELLIEHQPRRIVIEIPSGKVHARLAGQVSSLATYGMAVGAMLRVAWDHPDRERV